MPGSHVHRGRRVTVTLLTVGGLVTVVVLLLWPRADTVPERAAGPDLCARNQALNQSRADAVAPVSPGGAVTVVLGDSFAQGVGLPQPRQSWPADVGRTRTERTWVDAVGATGFVNGGFCRHQEFGTRVAAVVARQPALVVVQGGLNDLTASPEELSAAVDGVLAGLATVPRVVVVGPTAVPAVDATKVRSVDATLRAATTGRGRQYVSALTWTFPLISDRIHPTTEGQRVYANNVSAALAAPGP